MIKICVVLSVDELLDARCKCDVDGVRESLNVWMLGEGYDGGARSDGTPPISIASSQPTWLKSKKDNAKRGSIGQK